MCGTGDLDYNEAILDIWNEPWQPDLPGIIDAVFLPSSATPEEAAAGRAFHCNLLSEMARGSSPAGAPPVPLLEYNEGASFTGTAPFAPARNDAAGVTC